MVLFGLLFAGQTKAATLSLRASNASIKVGATATINLIINTQNKTINNAEASIRFSNDLIDVVSVKGSLFSLWVENPSFSNGSGLISFNGGVPNPGYNGSAKVLSIVVRAKKAGTASFSFSGAAVRENDGLGTDILSGQAGTSFLITAPEELKPEVAPTKPEVITPEVINTAVIVSSSIYQKPDAWYSASSGNLTWGLPKNVKAVETLVDSNPNSTPSVRYNTALVNKNLADLGDGIWYFHIRYLLNNKWSEVSHFKFQIDTTPPNDLNVSSDVSSDCNALLHLNANDALSGVDYYEFKIDDRELVKIPSTDSKNITVSPTLSSGSHQILVSVYDKAGNKSETSTSIFASCAPKMELSTSTTPLPISVNVEKPAKTTSYNWLDLIIKLILVIILLFGWYKYIVIKLRLKLIKKNAEKLTLISLFEKSSKDLIILDKAKKKKVLTKNEEKALINLRQEIEDIEKIVKNKYE